MCCPALLAIKPGIPNDATGWWKFDDGTGTTAIDSSGNGNSGTLKNGPTWSSAARIGPFAVDLDGTDSKVIDAGTPALLNNVWATGASLCFWIYPRAVGGAFYAKGGFLSSGFGFRFCNSEAGGCPGTANTFRLVVSFSVVSAQWYGPANFLTLNQWNYVAIVYDGSSASNTPIVYINGISITVNTVAAPVGSIADDSASILYVGAFSDAANNTIDAKIDDFRIYKRLLSASEVLALSRQ